MIYITTGSSLTKMKLEITIQGCKQLLTQCDDILHIFP